MGQVMSGGLTQYDVEEVSAHCDGVFTQGELEALYKRFRSLDRGRKGYITAEEFLSIPELSINPLAQRLVRVFDSVNYKQFVKLLSAFSKNATKDAKLELMFHVYDVDGDGLITRDDMQIMLRQLASSSLTDADLEELISRCLAEAQTQVGLDIARFKAVLCATDLNGMNVDVPVEF